MKLVVGLGNPGKKYEGTRHNVGFVVLDRLVQQVQSPKFKVKNYSVKNYSSKFKINKRFKSEVLQIDDVTLAKPQTFVNRSGEAVGSSVRFYKVALSDLYVMHDDLDIPLGMYKIQFGKGPKQHNGLQSIYERLGTKKFWHVRIGIEHRAKGLVDKTPGEEYVLQQFTDEEREVIDRVIQKVVKELRERISAG